MTVVLCLYFPISWELKEISFISLFPSFISQEVSMNHQGSTSIILFQRVGISTLGPPFYGPVLMKTMSVFHDGISLQPEE